MPVFTLDYLITKYKKREQVQTGVFSESSNRPSLTTSMQLKPILNIECYMEDAHSAGVTVG